jgi:hypothetical protein
MASGRPLRPSQHTMKVSCTPRLRSSVNKLIQLFWCACQGFRWRARVGMLGGASMWSPLFDDAAAVPVRCFLK